MDNHSASASDTEGQLEAKSTGFIDTENMILLNIATDYTMASICETQVAVWIRQHDERSGATPPGCSGVAFAVEGLRCKDFMS